jgi:predicted RND superfamily exporter protein
VLSIASLAVALAVLLAAMTLFGWQWNLMNVMALPLLFGAGVDYAIHIQHGLRRNGGDVVRVRNTVGRAILLCAASTAAGFGTLGLGSNAGVATLGRVCAVGVVTAALVSVFLLPQWWRAVDRAVSGRG